MFTLMQYFRAKVSKIYLWETPNTVMNVLFIQVIIIIITIFTSQKTKSSKNSKVELQTEKGRGREIFQLLVHFPNATMARANIRSLALHPGLQHGWQRPKYHLLVSQVHQQAAGNTQANEYMGCRHHSWQLNTLQQTPASGLQSL